ncbi:adhesion regulating molecule [Fomitiporia mediterranea MF3/22]|uniref:adhesion regulating molecule n=1 Tax=Fomitiporia mediterranea (strain MF3/22) TaxID=694068 RepID=UPI0004407275|nr:adhesion regulating molecule [Fomitiporia mediterranea MF3/22]EJC98162.1 adhesion regulating molecule [Fomitiporia mediterranea MF3/22]
MASEPLLAFKAGRYERRPGTNSLDAVPTKGAIYMFNEDGLLHFQWRNRETNQINEDLILFSQDASFSKVPEAPGGRTYVLRFMSSNQKHFFWLQDASPARDEEFVNNVNALLEDPERPLTWNTASSSSSSAPQASTSRQGAASSSMPPLDPTQLAHLRQLVTSMTSEPPPTQPTVSLQDVLTVETLGPLFTNHPDLIPSLFPHLPADLPMPPSAEVLQQIIASPQFQVAVRNFDQALHTGLLGGLVRQLGLPEEAGTGVEAFLRAVQEQARQGGDNSSGSDSNTHDQMETD